MMMKKGKMPKASKRYAFGGPVTPPGMANRPAGMATPAGLANRPAMAPTPTAPNVNQVAPTPVIPAARPAVAPTPIAPNVNQVAPVGVRTFKSGGKVKIPTMTAGAGSATGRLEKAGMKAYKSGGMVKRGWGKARMC